MRKSQHQAVYVVSYVAGLPISMILILTAAKDIAFVPQGGSLQMPLTYMVLGTIAVLWISIGGGYLWTMPASREGGSGIHTVFNLLLIPFMIFGFLAVLGLAVCTCGGLLIPS